MKAEEQFKVILEHRRNFIIKYTIQSIILILGILFMIYKASL